MKTVHSITAVVVSEEVICCDGKLLAEMSDGSVLQFSIYKIPAQRDLDSWGIFGWRYKTREELVKMVGDANREHMMNTNELLRMDNIRRLGWDHAQRGY